MLEQFFFISFSYSYFAAGCRGIFINATAIHLIGRMVGLKIFIRKMWRLSDSEFNTGSGAGGRVEEIWIDAEVLFRES